MVSDAGFPGGVEVRGLVEPDRPRLQVEHEAGIAVAWVEPFEPFLGRLEGFCGDDKGCVAAMDVDAGADLLADQVPPACDAGSGPGDNAEGQGCAVAHTLDPLVRRSDSPPEK